MKAWKLILKIIAYSMLSLVFFLLLIIFLIYWAGGCGIQRYESQDKRIEREDIRKYKPLDIESIERKDSQDCSNSDESYDPSYSFHRHCIDKDPKNNTITPIDSNFIYKGMNNREYFPKVAVHIVNVKYGKNDKYCDATSKIIEKCKGKQCSPFKINNDLCGDPLVGPGKHIIVKYNCWTNEDNLYYFGNEYEDANIHCN